MAVLCEPLRRGEPRCHGDYSVLPCARPAERGLRVVRSFGSDSLDRLVTTASFSSGLRSGRRPRARAAAARVVSFRRADVSLSFRHAFRMRRRRGDPPRTLSFDFDLTRRLSPSRNNIITTPAPPKAKRAGMRTQTRPLARSNSFSERGDPGCGSICTFREHQSSTGCAHRAPGGVGYILNPLAAHLTPCTSTQVMAPRPIRSDVR